MRVVILAGGFGTRLQEETSLIPKPLVTIGEHPILWHIMKIYSSWGFNDFIICLGYKGFLIKEYFSNYFLHRADITFDFSKGKSKMIVHNKNIESWKVTLIDTGLYSHTGGRLKRIQPYVKNETFMLTYGDAVADINIKELVAFHLSHKKAATVTASQHPGKFGVLKLGDETSVECFDEKPFGEDGWINGGFFVLEPEIFDYMTEGDKTIWERGPLKKLARDGQLMAYLYRGFWKCMDTLRDSKELGELWASGNAPWKIWDKL